MVFDQLLASQALPEASICTAVRSWIALLRKPCAGDSTVPVEAPGGQAAMLVPHSSDTDALPKPATHTRSCPSMAIHQCEPPPTLGTICYGRTSSA
ncbi:hypothetical protein ACFVT2_07920 [Streptomyces sp. NPDC058000]|uniref:hypothetical protein n=1 Tax=Streptomyces sp. NPDC058000 TaxID=3346299 RepID=UPI0036EB23DA